MGTTCCKLCTNRERFASLPKIFFASLAPLCEASESAKSHGDITILLTSIKTPPFDLGQWRSQGIEPTKLAVIGVKAAVAHRRAYDPIAARMLWVDTPGPCRSDLSKLPFKHVRRPVYPLDR